MTVAELIAQLNTLPLDAVVVVHDLDTDYLVPVKKVYQDLKTIIIRTFDYGDAEFPWPDRAKENP